MDNSASPSHTPHPLLWLCSPKAKMARERLRYKAELFEGKYRSLPAERKKEKEGGRKKGRKRKSRFEK